MHMNENKVITIKAGLLTAVALLGMFALVATANATPINSQHIRINFSGSAGSGYANLTIAPDPLANAAYDPDNLNNTTGQLSPYDPAGAWRITNASGSFNNSAITGIVPTSPGVPPILDASTSPPTYENLLASFSWLNSGSTPPANSYDNLFYPDGSPIVCPPSGDNPYVFHGGFLDIFGAMFTLDNDNVVGLWSDGNMPGGLTYGLALLKPMDGGGYSTISSQFAGATAAVPAPSYVWLFAAAMMLGMIVLRRRRIKSSR